MNPRKRPQDKSDSRESSPALSSLRLETSSESENDDCDSNREEPSKRMKMDNVDFEPDVGVECDGKQSEAQTAWRLVEDDSVSNLLSNNPSGLLNVLLNVESYSLRDVEFSTIRCF